MGYLVIVIVYSKEERFEISNEEDVIFNGNIIGI